MNTETALIREPVKAERVLTLSKEIATKASNLLGYKTLLAQVRVEECKIEEVLRDLEIHPFTDESVKKYMAEKLAKANAPLGASPLEVQEMVAANGFITRVVSRPELMSWEDQLIGRRYYSWDKKALGGYERAVPEFALDMACSIKEREPTAEFFVHELVEKKIDPFLSVECGGKSYFIAHWDEPDFRVERKV